MDHSSSNDNVIISIDNYDEFEDKYYLNRYAIKILILHSPRSLEACKREGIKLEELVKK
jgi:hypothetical protein